MAKRKALVAGWDEMNPLRVEFRVSISKRRAAEVGEKLEEVKEALVTGLQLTREQVEDLRKTKEALVESAKVVDDLLAQTQTLDCSVCFGPLFSGGVFKQCGHALCLNDYAKLAQRAIAKCEDMKCPICRKAWGWCGEFLYLDRPTEATAARVRNNWDEMLAASDQLASNARLHEAMRRNRPSSSSSPITLA